MLCSWFIQDLTIPHTDQILSKIASFLLRKIVNPISALLLQGISPHKLAFALSAGIAIAVFPIFGSTTILCAIVAFIFRLNMPAIQLANYLAYPFQFILFLPFIRLGEWIFNVPANPISVKEIFELIKNEPLHAVQLFGATTLRAIVAWTITALPAAGTIYFIIRKILGKFLNKKGTPI